MEHDGSLSAAAAAAAAALAVVVAIERRGRRPAGSTEAIVSLLVGVRVVGRVVTGTSVAAVAASAAAAAGDVVSSQQPSSPRENFAECRTGRNVLSPDARIPRLHLPMAGQAAAGGDDRLWAGWKMPSQRRGGEDCWIGPTGHRCRGDWGGCRGRKVFSCYRSIRRRRLVRAGLVVAGTAANLCWECGCANLCLGVGRSCAAQSGGMRQATASIESLCRGFDPLRSVHLVAWTVVPARSGVSIDRRPPSRIPESPVDKLSLESQQNKNPPRQLPFSYSVF